MGDRVTRRLFASLLRAPLALSMLAGAVFLFGATFTDRWHWSQWIWWVPWPMLALVALPGVIVSFACRRYAGATLRHGARISAAVILLGGVARDVRLPAARLERGPNELYVVHWNASWPDTFVAGEPSKLMLGLGADVFLLSNPYRFFNDGRLDTWRAAGYDVVIPGFFAVASRSPILEARTLFGGRDGAAAWFVLDTTATIGRPLRILIVDLPSDPNRSRREIAQRFAVALTGTGIGKGERMPDLVVGDFNVTRGSASLNRIATNHHHAWNDAGRGWGASWPRGRPILHLDHMLLGPSFRATGYRLFDPGGGYHLAQECVMRVRDE